MDAFRKGLAMLADLVPNRERDRLEVELLSGLGFTYIATQGFSAREVGEIYGRARELGRRGDTRCGAVACGHGWVRGDPKETAALANVRAIPVVSARGRVLIDHARRNNTLDRGSAGGALNGRRCSPSTGAIPAQAASLLKQLGSTCTISATVPGLERIVSR